MKQKILHLLIIFPMLLFASGAYDNGTATGKGRFQIDITWNPFNRFEFGQSYAVMSYGITNQLEIHGYVSNHSGRYYTWYGGVYFQFLKLEKLHLATSVGVRRQIGKDWTHIFFPQLLYTVIITPQIYIGGSFVDVRETDFKKRFRTAVDIGLFYKLNLKTERLESVSMGVSLFHPTERKTNNSFLPTYSIDFKFKIN